MIPATDSHVRYVGRFDFKDPEGPRCEWSASTVELALRGSNLKARIRETGQDQLQVVVDGSPTQVIKLEKGDQTYDIANNLPFGNHLVQLVKRSEAWVGMTQFLGYDVDGSLQMPKKPKHVIEVIGDSISCGFGNEGKSHEEHFKIDTENAYMTYGAIAARDLGADFVDLAWSGRKMWPDNTMPEIYDFAFPDDKTSPWDMKKDVPSVIVINLATNDFGKENPDEKSWTEAYAAFIGRLRVRAPKAKIYCAYGPMMSDNWPPGTKALTTLKRYLSDVVALREAAGDKNLRALEFTSQDEVDGIGSDWHPSVKTHQKMAKVLADAIRQEVRW